MPIIRENLEFGEIIDDYKKYKHFNGELKLIENDALKRVLERFFSDVKVDMTYNPDFVDGKYFSVKVDMKNGEESLTIKDGDGICVAEATKEDEGRAIILDDGQVYVGYDKYLEPKEVSNKEAFRMLLDEELKSKEGRKFLVELYEKGESEQDITDAASLMRERMVKIDLPEELRDIVCDNCGTGGDSSGSFNISTSVSFVVASCGGYVARHGNRAVTSKSGSADLIEALGVNLNLAPEKLPVMLQECNFMFMFAQKHFPFLKHVTPIRKSIPHRTIFNLLGPLCNPAGAKKQLLGVFDQSFNNKVAGALKNLGAKRAMVMSSEDGMDEISISASTRYTLLEEGELKEGIIDPREYGFKLYDFSEMKGGDAIENAKILRKIFSNELDGALKDVIILNAGALLFVNAQAATMEEGIAMAREAIESGKTLKQLDKIVEVSKKL